MSWMTPVSADMGSLRCLAVLPRLVSGLLVAEQFLDPAAPLLEPVEREAEIGDRVTDGVVRTVALQPDEHCTLVGPWLEAALPELGEQQLRTLLDLDQQDLACLGQAGHRVGAQQPAPLDRHQVTADPL